MHCGSPLPVLRWVAEPPPGLRHSLPAPSPATAAYTGPPCYPAPPSWGFPALPWAPGKVRTPPGGPAPAVAVQTLAGTLVPMLWVTVVVALAAACAEGWRYALLLDSREGALSAGVVAASDAFVGSAGLVAPTLAALSGVLLVTWTLRAAQAAGDATGARPSRSPLQVALGWVVPGLNLTMPGSVLAEIEHTALRRPAQVRPRPSPLLLGWWALWSGGVLLGAVVLLWSLRQGVQARADGVVLHALLDLLAAATAAVTAVLVRRLTRLLGPVRRRRREVVVTVPGQTRP